MDIRSVGIEGLSFVWKQIVEFPVWWFIMFINIGSLFFVHFSPIARIRIVERNKGVAVFIYASLVGSIIGILDLVSKNFGLSEENVIYQVRLISSYFISVIIYEIGGLKWLVNKLKGYLNESN